jgi:putative radical SAM enzyme (TIGR03279 family)
MRTPVHLYLDEQATGVRRQEPAESASSDGGLVDAVRRGSLAAAAGVRPGARVLAANGRILRDVIDYQFYTAEERVTLRVRLADAQEQDYTFQKWPDDDLGLEFAQATWDGVRVCTNTCFFCFLKGLPKAMRRTLYLKDDDYRLSFLHGNFVTLTNLTEADWQRLEEQRLSPLNVSVHATEPELRRRMLGYPDAPDIMPQLRRLGELDIQAHTQIVLCPRVNDGPNLDRSIEDLGALYPTVQTISIVPVGATEQFEQRMELIHSRALDDTRACSPAYAREIVRQVSAWQRRFREKFGSSVVQAADEYHLIAGTRIPAAARYDDFPQYENGIGMTRVLLDDWRMTKSEVRSPKSEVRKARDVVCAARPRLTVASGALIAPVLAGLFAEFSEMTGVESRVMAVRNEHFGARINVSGLLVGKDIIATLQSEELGDVVVLPRTALDYFGRKFLDDTTPADVERALGRPVIFASGMSEVIEELAALAAGTRPEPATPAATNGIVWAQR